MKILPTLCLLFSTTAFATDLRSVADEAALIRTARLGQNQAIAHGEVNLIASYWTDDVTICRGLGVQLAGKPAYRQLFQDDPKDGTSTVYERIPDEIEASPDWLLAFESGH